MQTLVQKFSTGLGFLGLMLLAFQGAALAANEDTCTAITTVPFTISLPGPYCLTKDLSTPSTSGTAITVSSNDVTLDLGGHTLNGLAAGTGTQAVGIGAANPTGPNRQNITVRNGTVRGFYVGISLTFLGSQANSSGHLVENVRADFNREIGIQVLGAGSVVRQNQVLHTGGSTVSGITVIGLSTGGNGAQVLDNVVVDTAPALGALGIGIFAQAGGTVTGMVIEGNRVSNVTIASSSVAIDVNGGAYNTLVVNNRIADFDFGIYFSNAGKYRDNLAIDTNSPYGNGGTDEGNNE